MDNLELRLVKKELNQYKVLFYVMLAACAFFGFMYIKGGNLMDSSKANYGKLKPLILDAYECKGMDRAEAEKMVDELFE